MFRLFSPPVFKFLFKADNQNFAAYDSFIKRLNRALGQDRFSVFSKSTFDKKTKVERFRKTLIQILKLGFWFSSASTIALAAASVTTSKTVFTFNPWVMITLLIAVSCGSYVRVLNHKPASDISDGLLESSEDYKTGKLVENWLREILKNDASLFIQYTGSGTVSKFLPQFLSSRNILLGILGDGEHRQAIDIVGHLPEGPILYLRADEDKIFSPLEAALEIQRLGPANHIGTEAAVRQTLIFEQIDRAADPAPSPQEHHTKSATKQNKRNPKTKSEIERARIKSAKRRGTYYEKETPKARDYGHLQIILERKDMMKLFVTYSDTEEFSDHVVGSSNARKSWAKTLKYIYLHWDLWIAYKSKPNSNSVTEFIKTLYGPDYLNIKKGNKKRKSIRFGKHREMSDFVIHCFIIPISEFSKDQQIEMF